MREPPRFSEVKPLSPVEIQNLLDRMTLADAFDRRGWDVRLTSYAEKLALLPRLVRTIVELKDALAARGERERSAAPQPERDHGSGGAHLIRGTRMEDRQLIEPDRTVRGDVARDWARGERLEQLVGEVILSAVTRRGWERRDERSIQVALAARALLEVDAIDAREAAR